MLIKLDYSLKPNRLNICTVYSLYSIHWWYSNKGPTLFNGFSIFLLPMLYFLIGFTTENKNPCFIVFNRKERYPCDYEFNS